MVGGYSTMRKDESKVMCTSFGYGSEGDLFHVIACKMNHTNEECADMHLILGEVHGNSAVAEAFSITQVIQDYLFYYIAYTVSETQ
jgi:hypothetical protein